MIKSRPAMTMIGTWYMGCCANWLSLSSTGHRGSSTTDATITLHENRVVND